MSNSCHPALNHFIHMAWIRSFLPALAGRRPRSCILPSLSLFLHYEPELMRLIPVTTMLNKLHGQPESYDRK